MEHKPFVVALADILPSNAMYDDMVQQLNFNSRFDFWYWLESNYGAVRSDKGVMSLRFGYSSTAVEFPNKEKYVEYCLTWL
jgi:hypothetical protein